MNELYDDIIHKAYKQPLQNYIASSGATVKLFRPPNVSHEDDFNRIKRSGKQPNESEEVYQMRLQRLENHINWLKNNK